MTNGRGSSQRLKFEDVKQLFADRGFELLEDTYVNTRTKMKFKCTKNHISSISVDNLKKGCNCSECAGNKKLTIEEIKEYVEKFGYKVYDNEYINGATKLTFECNRGHIYPARWSQFKQRGHRCPYCSGNKKYTLEEVASYFSKEGYQLLSQEYNGAHKNVESLCPEGHLYECTLHNFLKGKRCSLCSKISKGEQEVQKVLDKLGLQYKFQHTFDDCKRILRLPFDFYLPDYNTVIEYDGEQHFYPIDFAGRGEEWANKEFLKVQERDNAKTQYCIDNDICLIRIPYDQFMNVEQILKTHFKNKSLQRLSL